MKYCPTNFMAFELMVSFKIGTDLAANWLLFLNETV